MTETVELQAIDGSKYIWAGWLAIASAVLLVPEIALAITLGFLSPDLQILVIPFHIINLAIGIYILYMFRQLLNQRYDFHKVDLPITILIVANFVIFIIGLFDFAIEITGASSELSSILSVITLALFAVYCVIDIVFAVILLKLKDDLFGLLKPYAYTAIISSILGATILLAPLGLLFAVGNLIILGMIFLRAKREAEFL